MFELLDKARKKAEGSDWTYMDPAEMARIINVNISLGDTKCPCPPQSKT
jgi:hypothetical protein